MSKKIFWVKDPYIRAVQALLIDAGYMAQPYNDGCGLICMSAAEPWQNGFVVIYITFKGTDITIQRECAYRSVDLADPESFDAIITIINELTSL